MKKIILPLVIGLVACGNQPEDVKNETVTTDKKEEVVIETNEDTPIQNEVDESEFTVDESTVNSKYNYDTEWEVFKTAVINKDVPGIGAFASSDEVDAEYLLTLLSEPSILKDLKNTSYNDLKTVEENGEILLEFHSEETAIDEEGNETGSSISVFFTQGEPSLLLEYFIAAG